ncbi:MAG TPA: hypothetical protein VFH54_11975 [Mycobacteriales bacterium]|nr:hypothetical protein [Mycobacteriales bacterium]
MAAKRKSRPGQSTGLAYGAAAAVLVILLAALALSVHQPPPPEVAAFAPGAVHQIKHPPPNQAGRNGSGSGGNGAGNGRGNGAATRHSASPPPPPTTPPPAPAQFTCVGNPPRQILDPQSPPCVPFWNGNNGGATAVGVTGNQITIVAPTGTYGSSIYSDLQTFFNQHFQFYGRRLNIVDSNSGGQSTAASQKADADNDYAKYKPFGALVYHSSLGTWYRQEMARLGVVYADSDGSYAPPYPTTAFGYLMNANEIFQNLGQWTCNQLAGHPAAHGGTAVQKTTRKFGIFMNTYLADDPTNAKPLIQELAKCGAAPASADVFYNTTASNQQVMEKFAADHVTSIFCLCASTGPSGVMSAAEAIQYMPEWIFSSYGYSDDPYFIKAAANPPQLAHAFGLTEQPPSTPLVDQPVYWAVHSVDPTFAWDYSDINRANNLEPYRSLLIMASGIQMAGPHLTAATFAAGLRKAMFPNPTFYTKPGAVGFNDATRTMTTDSAMWWWSDNANEPVDANSGGPGTDCYVENGKRFSLNHWPRMDANKLLFSGACNTGSGF